MKIYTLLLIVILNVSCASSQEQIINNELKKEKEDLNKRKKANLKSLENIINKFVKLDSVKQRDFYKINLLSQREFYPYLKRYSNELAIPLFRHYKLNEYYRKALGLIDLPQNMRDSIINYSFTEKYIKATLGDLTSEKEIIEEFNSLLTKDISDNNSIKKLMRNGEYLLYINSEFSLENFIKSLESKVSIILNELAFDKKEGYKFSVIIPLLNLYNKVNTYDYLNFNSIDTSKFIGLTKRNTEMEQYFNEIETYFFKKYNFKITISTPFIQIGEEEIIEDQIIEDPNKN